MFKVYLLLGTNLGDKKENLEKASAFLSKFAGKILKSSSVYKSAPWGKQDQPEFLNQVLLLETTLSPSNLLKVTRNCEEHAGRVRLEKWGERILDVDILYYGNEIVVKKDLKIPHPEILNRRFTLIPLTEIAPDHLHPVLNLTNKELLEKCTDKLEVEKI